MLAEIDWSQGQTCETMSVGITTVIICELK